MATASLRRWGAVNGLARVLLKEEKDPKVTTAAALSLAHFMPTAVSISALKSRLKDKDIDTRSAVAIALLRLGEGDSAVEVLADVWDAEHQRYHGDNDSVSQLLTVIGSRIGSFPENRRTGRTNTIVQGLKHRDRSIRVACAGGLAAIGRDEYDTAPVVVALDALLNADDRSAFEPLADLADHDENDEALAALERVSRSHKNGEIRRRAAEAVAKIKAKPKND